MWKTLPFEGIKEINGIKMMSWVDPKKIEYIILHHTAVQTKTNQIKSIENEHTVIKGYSTYIYNKYGRYTSLLGSVVGYNALIDVKTPFKQHRVLGEETTANRGLNASNRAYVGFSLCISGNFAKKVVLSDNQTDELTKWVPILCNTFPNAKFIRHTDVPNNETKCSGLLTPEYIEQFYDRQSLITKLALQVMWALYNKVISNNTK